MSPLPGTKVIPPGWSRHHAPVAAGGMNAKCRIYDPALQVRGWDSVTESATLDRGTPVYDGPCRIQALSDARSIPQADEQVAHRSYLVQLLFDAPAIRQGWTVEPYDVINDMAGLNNQVLIVEDPQEGSERFTRDLSCTHIQR